MSQITSWTETVREQLDRRPWLRLALVALLFIIATVVMTWPLTSKAGSVVQDPGDPLFEIWVMRAVQHKLATDPLSLYDANAFYPFDLSLAYSEEAISSALLAWPVYLISGNQVLAYNWVLLSSFWLMGFGVYLLTRELGATPGAAILAGIIAAFFPDRYAHLSHLHLLVLGWLPIALWALVRLHRSGQTRYVILAGVVLTIQLLGSLHLAVFSTLVLGIFLLCLLLGEQRARLRDWRYLKSLTIALLIPYLILIPTLIPHLRAGDRYGFARSRDEVQDLAVGLDNYWSVFVSNHLLANWLPERATAFFPGFVALVGVVGIVFAVRRRSWPVLFAIAITLTAALLSFGFDLQVGDLTIPMPYQLIYDLVPPMRNVRGVGRFGLVTVLGVAVLAALGYSALWGRLRQRLGSAVLPVGVGLTILLSLAAGLELRSGVGTAAAPADPDRLVLYEWLAEQPDGPVVEFPSAGLLEGPFQPIEYMYYSTFHWKPILAGYSGYAPPAHIAILQELRGSESSPSMVTEANVGILQDLGIRYVIIHKWPDYDWKQAVEVADRLDALTRIAEVGDGVVYRLHPAERPVPTVEVRQIASQLSSGAHFSVPIRVINPNQNAAVVWLNGTGAVPVEFHWRNLMTGKTEVEQQTVMIPAIAQPGATMATLMTTAPSMFVDYRLRVEIGEPFDVTYEQVIGVIPPAELASASPQSGAKLALSAVSVAASSWRPGDDLAVDLSWYSLQEMDRDLTATVQLFDQSGNLLAQSDLALTGPTGGTASWPTATQVLTRHWLPLDGSLAPGRYDLLIAVYDPYQADLPRASLLMPDNSVGMEWWVRDVQLDGPTS